MSRSPRVIAVHQPTRIEEGRVVPSMDLSPATAHGELMFALHESHDPFLDLQETGEMVLEFLRDKGVTEDDFLLLVGNPVLIGVTAAVWGAELGAIRMLQWQRAGGCYQEASVDVADLFDDDRAVDDDPPLEEHDQCPDCGDGSCEVHSPD